MAAANILILNKTNFAQEVLKSLGPILVDFWGEHCPPCKMLAPILDELAGEYAGKMKIGKVNVGEDFELAAEYGIQSVPTLLLFKDGEVKQQIVGFKGKRDLQSRLEPALT